MAEVSVSVGVDTSELDEAIARCQAHTGRTEDLPRVWGRPYIRVLVAGEEVSRIKVDARWEGDRFVCDVDGMGAVVIATRSLGGGVDTQSTSPT